MNQNIRSLYQQFRAMSNSELTEDHFERLVFYFPAILVVMSDGLIDKQEWVYIKYLAKFISETFVGQEGQRQEQLINQYSEALGFLVQNAINWEHKLLNVLKETVEIAPEIKEDIYDSLYLFAEASDGASETEQRKIDEISNFLNLK